MWWRVRSPGAADTPGEIDRAFAEALSPPRDGGVRVGIEHEYRVVGGADPVDFREIIGDLELGVAHLDPRDAFGFRLASGTWLTCDEAEAEVAMPPVPLAPGFGRAVASSAAGARADLERILGPGLRPDGFSTHVNVTASGERRHDAARLFARTFAPALMLLMDGPASPGLLVRSRPGRIELGGEFVEGDDLTSAALLAAGGVLACLARAAGRRAARDLPPELVVEPAAEWRRYGWYVDRRAFGPDLYREGRRAILTTSGGKPVTAQSQLAAAWRSARRELPYTVDRADVERVDAAVAGTRALPLERDGSSPAAPRAPLAPAGETYGSAVRVRSRGAFDLGAVLATWELTVFVLADRARTRRAFACVPDAFLARFLALLDGGRLDALLGRYLRAAPSARVLEDRSQAQRPGLWDELGARRGLLRPEIRPQGARP
ncbi:MAG: hypothetical protein KGN00_10700 [Chloroflexota bacterium]|nr:hypothetical protein [Chloroflexota bacterium]